MIIEPKVEISLGIFGRNQKTMWQVTEFGIEVIKPIREKRMGLYSHGRVVAQDTSA